MLSPVSGCIYERRLIEKCIQESGADPMSGEKLTADMLIEVKSECCFLHNVSQFTRIIMDSFASSYLCKFSQERCQKVLIASSFPHCSCLKKRYSLLTASPLVKPRPPSATSIPAILKTLQDEWVSELHKYEKT